MNGFINVYKEMGMTSHDVVNKVRKIFNTRTVGHTGTLDPNARGVLPIAIGSATKVIEYMEKDDKTYVAELTLGISTDTEDIWGNVLEERSVDNISEEEIIMTVQSFVGNQKQVPPMYSALKIDGKKLYELAREGKTIAREARDIEIYQIDGIDIKGSKVSFKVHCSKGTYIRTLCKDIGEKLGCGATMSSLERVQAGKFIIDTSKTLEEIEKEPSKYVIDLEVPLKNFEVVNLSSDEGSKYINGVKFPVSKVDGRYRAYIDNVFYGICTIENGIIKSEKRIIK